MAALLTLSSAMAQEADDVAQMLDATPAADDVALPSREDAVVLETLVVSGTMPGPGMWKVRRDGHTMWILGTLQPVARRMEWESGAVERQMAASSQILLPPSVKFDLGMGRFRTLMLVPSMLGARKNPDGEKLVEHVPAVDYARWLTLKKKYLGRDRGVEKRRPIFAAQELYNAAVEKSGLQFKGMVSPLIEKVTKRHGIASHRPRIEIAIADPRAAIRAFRQTAIDDVECFRKTLDHLDADLEKMRIRANAWARGDMLTLREITYEDQSQACMDAVLESRFAKEQGIEDLPERLEAAWLEAAERIIAEHETSFAALPISRLVAADGYLEKLVARGYEVTAP
ncbi:TraB/GumN family protein [Xanthomonadaceae bacterium XH05]|nr:TraB/GumN family protein [Xanthomonadaceae bacterium XH05]